MLNYYTLENGLKAVTYNIPSLRSMHLQISVKGGSLVEKPADSGLAHFMEHMLVQGIPAFPNAQLLSAYIEGLAGKYNAYTSQLSVSFGMTVPFPHTKDALHIGSEIFFEPLFPQEALEKERRAVLNEIHQDMDSRWFKFQEFFKKTRYSPGSPLISRVGGNINVVEKITRDDLIRYWKEYFIPKNTYIFLIGNLLKLDISSLLERYFGKYSSEKTFSGFPKMNNDTDLAPKTVAIRTDKELQVNYLDLIFPSLAMEDDLILRVKQNITLIILGRLRTSRLFQLLRYEKGLVYGISSSDSQWPSVGHAYISSEVSSEHLDEVIELIIKEIINFRQKGPLDKELEFTKNYLSNSWLMSFDNPSSIAEWISDDFLWKDKILLPEDYIKLIKDISVKDLIEVMQNHWDMEKVQLIIQGPLNDSEKNRQKYLNMLNTLSS